MKKRYIISLIHVVVSVISFTSCEDKLDIQQHSVSAIDSYYQTDSEAEEGIVACYGAFRSIHSGFLGTLQQTENNLSDDIWPGGGNHYDGSGWQLGDYTFDAANGTITSLILIFIRSYTVQMWSLKMLQEKVP